MSAPTTGPVPDHGWQPRASCDESCVRSGAAGAAHPVLNVLRVTVRTVGLLTLLAVSPLLLAPLPGRVRAVRAFCRTLTRCAGVRITVSGGPIRNLRGVLVVSGHVSWLDVFVIAALLPGCFVARADLVDWPGVGWVARLVRVIPIHRTSLRRLPAVVRAVAGRLSAGGTVVAFPEGTTWCGLGYGRFRPAMFQGAIDAGRPVQPLRLAYRHRDGRPSTVPAFVGDDSLLASLGRVLAARRTVCHVTVPSLQLPGTDRRDLAMRCETAVRETTAARVGDRHADRHALAA